MTTLDKNDKKFSLQILTPKAVFYAQRVDQLNLEIAEGRIGFKAHHSSLISSIKTGKFSIEIDHKLRKGVILNGIVSFVNNEALVFTSRVNWSADINLQFVKQRYSIHQEMLKKSDLLPTQRQNEIEKTLYYQLQIESKEQGDT